ncbi:hypothetical protein Tco_1005091 [Tanacetum coccineum]|uniref:Uncharacterized protein n=1 Tax=Tanacetum coccineum TaxID=301880 RepID=A0ABQ5FEC8_9ASTR
MMEKLIWNGIELVGCLKITAWNEFSSTMASAIICLATNQCLNFSKLIFDSMVRNLDNISGVQDGLGAAITASRLKAEQVSGNINKTQSKAILNEPSSPGTSSGSGPRCQETLGDTIAQTRVENVSKLLMIHYLARGNTLQSDEDSLKLTQLMELYTNLQEQVLDLEKTKTTQAKKIISLKRRVKKLKQKKRLRIHGLKRLRKVGATARVDSSKEEIVFGEDCHTPPRRKREALREWISSQHNGVYIENTKMHTIK